MLGLVAAVPAVAGAAVMLLPPGDTGPAAPAPPRAIPAPECSPADPCLAVVVDDLGRDPGALRQLLSLSELDLTFAVLPHAPHSALSAAAIQAAGRELIVHVPMTPRDPQRITDEPLVVGRDAPLEGTLGSCLDALHGAAGASNHMGSALSDDPRRVDRVLRVMRRRGLWFLDSRTTGESQFCARARGLNVSCVERDVFLDDPPVAAAVELRLAQATRLARDRGWAVAVGHPFPSTITVLRQRFAGRDGGGQRPPRVVRLSHVVAHLDSLDRATY